MAEMVEMRYFQNNAQYTTTCLATQKYPKWLFNQEYSGIFESLPNHLNARLMFYLSCVYKVLDIRDADSIEELIDYEHYIKLSSTDIDKLIVLAIALSPDRLLNKCFFRDEEKCGELFNEFYHKDELIHEMKISDCVQIGEDNLTVLRVMCFKEQFLRDNYDIPLQFYKNRIRYISDSIGMKGVTRQNNRGCFCIIM